MSTTPVLPTPDEVGAFYDQVNHLLQRFLGGSMHYGYWHGPDDDSGFREASERFTSIMVDKLRVGPGDLVLDVGCGTGGPATQLARTTGARVVGISISAKDVELATARAAAEGVSDLVRFQRANALDLPFDAGAFDAALAFESIVHIPDRVAALRQIARVLKPGARLALTDAFQRGPEMTQADRFGLMKVLAAWRAAPLVGFDDYLDFAREAGFETEELSDVSANTKPTNAKVFEAIFDYVREHDDAPAGLVEIVDSVPHFGGELPVGEDDEEHEGVLVFVGTRRAG
ncbi:methyltransferase domain-containing protein [Actinosynnema sp. NPDC023587]|uniref:SAM-dependent methyltransferase n=1 Tax=Actinosynnema sp. NPDC023587 TaxID=3154695 RepID=UPI0033C05FAC